MTLAEEEKRIPGIPSRGFRSSFAQVLLYFAFPQGVNFMKQSDGMISITREAVLKNFDALATAKIVMVGIKLVLPCWK